MASDQPTVTGILDGNPVTVAPDSVTNPRRSSPFLISGMTDSFQPKKSNRPGGAFAVKTLHNPLLDHGSEIASPVK